MHYVIGDIHGCYEAFMTLLQKIEKQDTDARYILIGDIEDRGPEVLKTILWAIDNVSEDGKYQMILGNHEELHLKWFNTFKEWWNNKTDGAKEPMPRSRYDFSEVLRDEGLNTYDYVNNIMTFFGSLPIYKELDIELVNGHKQKYYIAHGWIDENRIASYSRDSIPYTDLRHEVVWEREKCKTGLTEHGEIIIHGHTPTLSHTYYLTGGWPGKIGYRPNSINIDCGCCYGLSYREPTNLAAICLENLHEFYAYPIKSRLGDSLDNSFLDKFNLSITELAKSRYTIYKEQYSQYGKVSDQYRKEMLKRLGLNN